MLASVKFDWTESSFKCQHGTLPLNILQIHFYVDQDGYSFSGICNLCEPILFFETCLGNTFAYCATSSFPSYNTEI